MNHSSTPSLRSASSSHSTLRPAGRITGGLPAETFDLQNTSPPGAVAETDKPRQWMPRSPIRGCQKWTISTPTVIPVPPSPYRPATAKSQAGSSHTPHGHHPGPMPSPIQRQLSQRQPCNVYRADQRHATARHGPSVIRHVPAPRFLWPGKVAPTTNAMPVCKPPACQAAPPPSP